MGKIYLNSLTFPEKKRGIILFSMTIPGFPAFQVCGNPDKELSAPRLLEDERLFSN
jgi:hypothetical protein